VFTLHGDLIRVSEKNGSVWIGMTTLVEAHRGEMKSAVLRLDLAFEGLSQSEIEEFVSSCSVCGYTNGARSCRFDGTGGVPEHGGSAGDGHDCRFGPLTAV
jgi:hypothetical protein